MLPRYHSGMTTISGTALEGLFHATRRLAQAAETVANAPVTGADDTAALIDAKLSVLEYRANAAVLKLEHERQKNLMDILA